MELRHKSHVLLCVLLLFFKGIIFLFHSLYVANADESCNRQRKILSDSYGTISSGGQEYPMASHCEWLIRANSSEQFITLQFVKLDTECSYDHVFVYDGDSYSSPLLGSFSGNATASTVTAKHGAMLMLLYSDTNYVRTGFEAIYSITDCPLNCSEKGLCLDHWCVCQNLQTGVACDIELCPSNCGQSLERGQCSTSSKKAKCKCQSGYSGLDCSLPYSNEHGGNTWHTLSSDALYVEGRAGHSGVYIEILDAFYIFGGYTFGKVLGDLWAFDFSSNNWINLTQVEGPSPRRDHAATSYGNHFVIFGGVLQDGTLTNELWLFNTSTHRWRSFQAEGAVWPPPVKKHSLTLVDDEWIYLFGGMLANNTFSSAMYKIRLHDSVSWENVIALGGTRNNRRVAGHSTVYYLPLKSLIVYGGIILDHDSANRPSREMYAFHVEKKYWIHLDYHAGKNVPLERAFHTSVIIGNYMVVFGGYAHRHDEEEICYDNEIYMYHLKCHRWINMHKMNQIYPVTGGHIIRGVFAHVMGVRHGHTLLIHGGYSGVMHSRFVAYILSPFITGSHDAKHPCHSHKNLDACILDSSCGWCPSGNICMERKNEKLCGGFLTGSCPGMCPILKSCQTCLTWGDPAITNTISEATDDNFGAVSCGWCVQDIRCFPLNELPLCSSHFALSRGWWGENGTTISSISDCYLKDFPPGLISAKYRHPVNWSQPDYVSLLTQASEMLYFRLEGPKNVSSVDKISAVKFIGFIHPLIAKLPSNHTKTVSMCTSGSHAILKLSNDTTVKNLEVVANFRTSIFNCFASNRASGSPLFPDIHLGKKYLFDFTVNLTTANETMELKWNDSSVLTEVDYHYLELYKNGSCGVHHNCFACLMDNVCGWCQAHDLCMHKENACEKNMVEYFMVTDPNDCVMCSDYVYCEHCSEVPLCEWVVPIGLCARRGRFHHAVQHPDMCPTPCHMRLNCSSCLRDRGICAWCEATDTCFQFSAYTTSYMFGLCRDWVDKKRLAPSADPASLCHDCSMHKDCKHCLQDLNCGWCSFSDDPLVGGCMQGDFRKPLEQLQFCKSFIEKEINTTLSSSSLEWSYNMCPDVEECLLGLHNCHQNASCKNTQESYICECNIGFTGDGKSCTQACIEVCVNGYCSGAPEYKCVCQLGWTGEDCSIDCGCNNHSFCLEGPGICDECQNFTQGAFCGECRPGSFGNALSAGGCQKCQCNNHGNVELGYCNASTGVCFCTGDTEGHDCSKCRSEYYGDPRTGHCFEDCKSRGIITDIVKGRLGSSPKLGKTSDCLWILTVHPKLDVPPLINPAFSIGASIQLILHEDMKIVCPHNHIYVYDGLPNFIYSKPQPTPLLGAFCGNNLSVPIVIVATTGYMTVRFTHSGEDEYFNATYRRLEESYLENQTCLSKDCDDIPLDFYGSGSCPNNCSFIYNHGICDMAYGKCLCEYGHGGDDCATPLKSHNLVWTSIYSYYQTIEKNSNTPSERVGHSLSALNNSTADYENVWLFGGYSSSLGNRKDLFMFDTFRRQWFKVETGSAPEARHFHASTTTTDSIYILGGLKKGGTLKDFWKFSAVTGDWIKLDIPGDLPPLAGSTLTAVGNKYIFVIGGFSTEYGFFDRVVQFNIDKQQWKNISCTGPQPIGLYGHTSVHHAGTESIYVFGGIAYEADNIIVSNNLYALNCSSKKWYRLPPDVQVNPIATRPHPRYFHTAVVTKNYMIILGGRGSSASGEFPNPFAYIFACNLWISLSDGDIDVVGKHPQNLVGGSAAIANEDIYLFGGFRGEMKRLSVPVDFCQLFSSSRVGCVHHTGCGFCSVFENGGNQTFCYSQNSSVPSKCYNPQVSSEVVPAVLCNSEWIEKRDCGQYSSCTDCLALWPIFGEAKQVCKWCSNCKAGRCIPVGDSCDKEHDCNIPLKVINESSACPLRECGATDCEKCQEIGGCIWTRQVLRSSGGDGHKLNEKPIYNWKCVMKGFQKFPTFHVTSMPPDECPASCSHYTNCSTCLLSTGGEGGWHQCFWSKYSESCMSPSFELLRCEDGSCGPVLQRNASICPVPCWYHEQASHCLSNSQCGWCAFSGPEVDGRGLCIEGGIVGPRGGLCSETQVVLLGLPLPIRVARWLLLAVGPPKWTYLTMPPENECANGHHTCDTRHEVCVDKLEGFECACKPGYNLTGTQCMPICHHGCVNGSCVLPDVCHCNFGYVGGNCSIACKCNGHSNCPGPDALNTCTDCQNNTQGSHCEKCKPFFVGDPVHGRACIPCQTYCYGHSDRCINSDLLLNNVTASKATHNQTYIMEMMEKVIQEGSWNDAVCLDCQNNTEGKRCGQCVSGFFKAGENFEDGCRPCECHGHGDTCNPFSGESCNCQNNTENDRQCSQKNTKNIVTPCWQLQCSKCKEYFLGAPARGHQCYRHMFLDKDYCFDPNNQDLCNQKPKPLLKGRTVFFAVQPRYMNVDIRVVVDVTEGGIDFFLSAKEDTFVVDVNKSTGIHFISVDRKYGADVVNDFDFIYYKNPLINVKSKREATMEDSVKKTSNITEPLLSSSLHLTEAHTKDLTTYITLKRNREFLLVRNLENRLIITIPQGVHDLRSTRFFMVLRGAGNEQSPSAYGSLFFRQDQTRIDLFVFFSVFFSCFFLFLANCVIAWKIKQAFDMRRARRLHAAEMKHMASRPFGHVMTIVDEETDDLDFVFYSPVNCRKKMKHGKTHGRDSPKIIDEKFCLRPIAVEPLSNGNAAITTILVQLPGGANGCVVRLALASALITVRSSHYYIGCGIRAAMRRRTSHANV